jgi:tellurite resistance protein
MDYLSRPGEGKYLEIQSGIAPTQNQRFALAAGAELDWTEAFFPVQFDADRAHDPRYGAAVAHAAQAVDAAIPADELARIDAFLREQARLPLDTRHSAGEPWGMRQEQLLGKRIAAGLDFAVEAPGDAWDDLARGLTLSAQSLSGVPDGIAVSKLWIDRVTASAAEHGETWLHALILATAQLDAGDKAGASEQVQQSLALRPSWPAYRLRALLAADADAAIADYLAAWGMGDAPPELAVEIAALFMREGRSAELKQFVDALPAKVRDNERIVLARAVVAANDGQFDDVETLLMSRQFASIREGETLLSDLWVRLRRGRLEAELKRPATAEEIKRDLRSHPLPRTLDLRMHLLEEA